MVSLNDQMQALGVSRANDLLKEAQQRRAYTAPRPPLRFRYARLFGRLCVRIGGKLITYSRRHEPHWDAQSLTR